ncbi:ankyrin repeat-containing domain protein [Rostrohypoxylon terebratum]|nr:ankyrin repeat-containing domain protein [Rostrohypoxylon terebratum]
MKFETFGAKYATMAASWSPQLGSACSSSSLNSPSTLFSNRSDIITSPVSAATTYFSPEPYTQPSQDTRGFSWEPSEPDYEWADRLMLEHCSDTGSSRRPAVFGYKEATAVLSSIADGTVINATPGLVQALLENDADVCFMRRKSLNRLKIMMGKNQEDIRSNLLERATLNCPSGILRLLIAEADELALDQALPIAMNQKDEEKVMMLRIMGADAGPLCDQFLRLVDSGADGVVKSLVTGFNGACQNCRDNGLFRAAKLGLPSMVQVLLKAGADVNFENGAALSAAIEDGWETIATSIISHQAKSPDHDVLDKAVLQSYHFGQTRVLKECLKAGAQGPGTALMLVYAIQKEQHELAQTLVAYGASIEYNDAEALRFAISTGKPELLHILFSHNPPQTSITTAFREVRKLSDIQAVHRMIEPLILAGLRGDPLDELLLRTLDRTLIVGDEKSRHELVDLLLKRGCADVNFCDGRPLALAAAEGWTEILELLISYAPQMKSLKNAIEPAMRVGDPVLRSQMIESVLAGGTGHASAADDLKATAFTLAARFQHLDILQLLVQSEEPLLPINAGLAEALSGGEHLFKNERGLEIIQFFLELGASGPLVEKAFCQAVRLFESSAIYLLEKSINPAAVDKALLGLIEHSNDWHSLDDRNIWVVEILLEWGASGETVTLVLIRAIQAYVSGRCSEALIDMILEFELADVNYNNAESLRIAARAGNLSLLRKLATRSTTRETLTHAFSEVVAAEIEEDAVISLINALILGQDTECCPDFSAVLPGRSPPIIECLTAHPESVKLVKYLAELGCDLEAKCDTVLFEQAEPVGVLIWSLKVDSPVSSPVIKALIDAKASVQAAAPLSRVTPLILAAMNDRSDVVEKLIRAQANTLARDNHDRTALYCASQVGGLNTVKALLKAKFRHTDGSLHEAARELHGDVVIELIKAGYDSSFPSSKPKHDGRTPIQELAYKCDGTKSASDIESTLLALNEGKINPYDKWHGKNPLFLALENSYAVTLALLDIVMWPIINHEDNVFVDRDRNGKRLFFSPTMYMKFYRSQAIGYEQLDRLLRTKHCLDRYYAEFGAEQPEGAVGLPDVVEKEDRKIRMEGEKRRRREQEHQDKIRWESEEAALKRENIALLHQAGQVYQQASNTVNEQPEARRMSTNQSEQRK